MKVQGLKHSSFRAVAADGRVIYFDPWQLPEHSSKADLILISHVHHDHCSPKDIAALSHAGTQVVASPLAAKAIVEAGHVTPGQITQLRAGEATRVAGLAISAVHAYNVNKFRNPGEPFHPHDPNFLGFVLTLDGRRLYFAGDTDVIPPEVGSADVAMVPVSGRYVMTPEEAAAAVKVLQPQVAMPMHYGSIVATRAEAERFAELAAPVPVEIQF